MNEDLFAEFSAEFEKPEETLLEQRLRIQAEMGILSKEVGEKAVENADQVISVTRPEKLPVIKASELTDEEIERRKQALGYSSMPEGLKELQEMNGVRDHGKGLIKGRFEWKDGDRSKEVVFVKDPNGPFSISDPDNLPDAAKDLLDRKFPGADYIGSNNEVKYACGIDPYDVGSNDSSAVFVFKNGIAVNPNYKPVEPEEFIDMAKLECDHHSAIDGDRPGFITHQDGSYEDAPAPEDLNIKAFDIELTSETPESFDGTKSNVLLSDEIALTGTPLADKPKFGRRRFNRAPKVEGEEGPNKINASKIKEHGITFDSKLENYMYNLLNDEGIEFEFQKEYILQEGFKYMHESILPVKIIIDFVFKTYPVICDTKGFQMTDNKIKHKMLKHYFAQQGKEIRIVMPSSQKKCRELVDQLRNGFKVEEPLTEHAATARKNKLKKNKFEWAEGYWIKGELKYLAAWIMQLPKYDFEELLIASDRKDLGICMNCKRVPAVTDYNGHKHYVCQRCDDSLNRYFEEEYK